MRTLHLNLKKKWFDMIASGEKREEYREVKPYWDDRLNWPSGYYDTVTFSNGYAADRPQVVVEFKSIHVAEGVQRWGAVPGVAYYVIRLGKVIE